VRIHERVGHVPRFVSNILVVLPRLFEKRFYTKINVILINIKVILLYYIILYFIVLILFYLILFYYFILWILYYIVILYFYIYIKTYLLNAFLYKMNLKYFFTYSTFSTITYLRNMYPIVPFSEVRQMERALNWSMEYDLTRRVYIYRQSLYWFAVIERIGTCWACWSVRREQIFGLKLKCVDIHTLPFLLLISLLFCRATFSLRNDTSLKS